MIICSLKEKDIDAGIEIILSVTTLLKRQLFSILCDIILHEFISFVFISYKRQPPSFIMHV